MKKLEFSIKNNVFDNSIANIYPIAEGSEIYSIDNREDNNDFIGFANIMGLEILSYSNDDDIGVIVDIKLKSKLGEYLIREPLYKLFQILPNVKADVYVDDVDNPENLRIKSDFTEGEFYTEAVSRQHCLNVEYHFEVDIKNKPLSDFEIKEDGFKKATGYIGYFENSTIEGYPIGKYSELVSIDWLSRKLSHTFRTVSVNSLNGHKEFYKRYYPTESMNKPNYTVGQVYYNGINDFMLYLGEVYSSKIYKKIKNSTHIIKMAGEKNYLFLKVNPTIFENYYDEQANNYDIESIVDFVLNNNSCENIMLGNLLTIYPKTLHLCEVINLNQEFSDIIPLKDFNLINLLEKIKTKFSNEYLNETIKSIALETLILITSTSFNLRIEEIDNYYKPIKTNLDDLMNLNNNLRNVVEYAHEKYKRLELHKETVARLKSSFGMNSINSSYDIQIKVTSAILNSIYLHTKSTTDYTMYIPFMQGLSLATISVDKKEYEDLGADYVVDLVYKNILAMA